MTWWQGILLGGVVYEVIALWLRIHTIQRKIEYLAAVLAPDIEGYDK